MKIRRLYLVLLFVLVAAVFIVLPGKSVYALGQGSCAVVINSNASGGLAVRTVPSTSSSTLIYRMPDGTKVRITGSPITFGGYTWWPHRGSNGISGWSAGNYLQETTNCTGVSAYTVANQLSQQVKLRNAQWIAASSVSGSEPVIYLDSIFGKPGQFPLSAPITSRPGMRSSALYAAVINQFAVGDSPQNRYLQNGYTYCNTFAGDVMRAMGVSLPIKSASDPATLGAAGLYNWLVAGNGWTRIYPNLYASDLTRLKSHVNAGYPALVATSGHIAVIRPGQTTTNWKSLVMAQAGATNRNSILLSTVWPSTTPAFFIRN
ncbi:MAG: SH3 domain-containing protein [Chloroflexi bacterium]|nr:SH3 domain-containing protein [Chloroflexota bacterium]MBP7044021.1 SH3 domain-containing protein [Chloroflexota bacterium]